MKDFRTLRVYELAFETAMEVFELTKMFPQEERYALTDQIRRSSRSICSNIAEGYRMRRYPKHFISKLTDADSECSETIVWLDFSLACTYLNESKHNFLSSRYFEIGKMLGYMIKNPRDFN